MITKTTLIALAFSFLMVGCETSERDVEKYDFAPPPVGLNAEEPGIVDSLFVEQAISGGTHEVALSRLGMERADNLDLKLLAQKIFDDHNRAMKELQLLVHLERIPVRGEPRPIPDLSQLNNLSGPAFDRAYIRHLREAHAENIKVFEAASRNAYKDEVRTFAGRFLPVLREHLRVARNIGDMADYGDEINEPAGAERPQEKRDPYYQGDPKIPHQFNIDGGPSGIY